MSQSPSNEYVHPETGEVLATEEDWKAAIGTLEQALTRIYGSLWPLREQYAERFPPADMPAHRRNRSETQEKVARCPRCGGRLESEGAAQK